MIKRLKFTYFLFFTLILSSCEKEEFVGPPIEGIFGRLEILEPFSHNKPVGVDFSLGDTVAFSSEFSVLSDYQIDIVGRTSEASYSINGSSSNLNDAYWLGNSDNIFFKQYEWCDITLSFSNYDTILSDSVLILGERDLSNLGLLLTSFEDPSEYSIVTSSNNDEFGVYSNSNIALHGNNYLNTLGIGSSSWFGAARFTLSNNSITESDPTKIYFNGFFNSDYLGSAFVIKVFEDENANGSYDSGIDEAYALKVNINADSQWHKYSPSFSSFIIDQSGNNILVDGILKPQNIIRIDITNSQSGSSNGQFGYLADYFLITYNEPL
jgi:hypothetical protein